ncbi:MAG: DUF2281 domain-containing protein [Candidatus Eremiobacterota bacterium]
MDKRHILIKEIEYIPEQYLDYILTFVEFIKINKMKEKIDISLMSESSLKKDWLKVEEDRAWQNL